MRLRLFVLFIAVFTITGCTAQLKEEKARCEAGLKDAQTENASLKSTIADFQNKLKKLEDEKAGLLDKQARLNKECEDLKKKSEQALTVIPADDKGFKPEKEKSGKETLTPEAGDSGQVQKKSAAVSSDMPVDDGLKKLEKENAALSDKIANLELQLKHLNSEIEAKDRSIAGLKKELKELNEKTQPLVEKDIKFKEMRNSIQTKFQSEIQKGDIIIIENTDAIVLRIVEHVFFRSGSAELSKDSKKTLDKISGIVKASPDTRVRIEGHTDNKRIGPKLAKLFPTNWELSSARSSNVAKYLISKGLDKKMLSIAGFANNTPVETNDTKAGRQKNRRIEVILIPPQVIK